MIRDKKVVVLPAYNAGETHVRTYHEIPFDVVDDVLLVDDCNFQEASSINFQRSARYGLGVIAISLIHFCAGTGMYRSTLYR